MRGALLLVLATGCNQILGVGTITLGDAGKTSGSDGMMMGTACVTGSLITPCFQTLPTGQLTIDAPINTDTDTRCVIQHQASGAGPDVCIIGGGSITVASMVRVSGARPLVLAAPMNIEIDGTLELDGGGGSPPAGAGTGPCNATAGSGGGGGGGGGSLGTPAGNGGTGPSGGAGGGGTSATPTFVRGGCPGGNGGSTATAAPGGVPGGGVYMVAGNSICLSSTGAVLASGGGGTPGQPMNGGGGGGASGGMIGFDSPSVELDGTAIASGGGGGGGAGASQGGGEGAAGNGTSATGGGGAVQCGSGVATGGNGGVDTANPTAGTSGAAGSCGGGGGGGSVGILWLNAQFSGITGTIEPQPIGP